MIGQARIRATAPHGKTLSSSYSLAAALAAAAAISSPAQSQTATSVNGNTPQPQTAPVPQTIDDKNPDRTAPDQQDVVVTGTSVRGLVAPVGSSTIAIDHQAVVSSGATNTVDLLASIPQLSTFGTTPHGTPGATTSFAVPSLRSLTAQPGDGTLFLLNGNRIVGGGFSVRADPQVIPPDAIERVEVVLGGGSAVYGSDAVAGTVNFILRRDFKGLQVSQRAGFTNDYFNYNADLTAGKVWSTGNLMATFDYARHNDILGQDRGYYTANNTGRGGSDYRVTACHPGNAVIGATTYALPGLVAGTSNLCDTTDPAAIYPDEERISGLVSFNQDIGSAIEVGVDGYYSVRHDDFRIAPPAVRGTIRSTNPYFQAPASAPAATAETIALNLGDVYGASAHALQFFRTWQITPHLNWKIGGGWQMRLTANVGYGLGRVHSDLLNASAISAAFAGTTAATAFNPYNPAATNPALLATFHNFDQYDERIHKMNQERAVFDGPLFEIGGGTVRAALGAEYYYESQYSESAAGPLGVELSYAGQAPAFGARHIFSGFGELVVPLVSDANAFTLVKRLDLDLSLRDDSYSDFGQTLNPKVAVSWSPVTGLTLRGDYSTSFVAPTLNQTTKPQIATLTATSTVVPPGGSANRPLLLLAGGNPNLRPETAKTFDLGFDFSPTALPGLKVSATYYHIDYKDTIAGVAYTAGGFFANPASARYYLLNPTVAQAQQFIGNVPVAPNVALDNYGPLQLVIDQRSNNIGSVKAAGLDYSVRYSFDTGIGTFTPQIAGTHGITFLNQPSVGSALVDNFSNGYPQDTFTTSLEYRRLGLNARATLNYLGGFPVQGLVNQTHVDPFAVVDLYVGYTLPSGPLKGSQLTFNLDNLLNATPSYENIIGGVGNGSTLGRLATIGIRVKF